MRKNLSPPPGILRGPLPRLSALALILALPLAACSGSSNGGADRGGDEDFPNLSRVPGQQPRPTPESLRKELLDGLAADHANARYSGEALTAATAAVPAAAPPPAAKPQVEIIWDTLRVSPEGEGEGESGAEAGAEEAGAEETEAAGESASPAPESKEQSEDEVQINWETERVEPSGQVVAAGSAEGTEELILAPGPELVAVVYFDHDSEQLANDDRAMLEKVVALYKERGGRLRLVGHASSRAGTEDEVAQRMVNLDLSLKRANAVAATLVDFGAEKDALSIEAKADSEAGEGDLALGGESADRRVEIFLEH